MRVYYTVAAILICLFLAHPARGQETQGYVVRVDGRLVFVDLGTEDNVHPGDFLQVVRTEAIIHPVTGENLGGEVPVGAVRIVQVLSRVSTAEVISLARDMNVKTMDLEARQGVIRVRPPSAQLSQTLSRRVEAIKGNPEVSLANRNPDGPLGGAVPQFSFGLGSRIDVALPARAYGLIAPSRLFGDLGTRPVPSVADGAYAELAASPLLSLTDTVGVDQALSRFGPSEEVGLSILLPIRSRISAFADLRFGNRVLLAGGARYYPGRLLNFFGKGESSDGEVGEPVVTLAIGWGGQGPTSLPPEVQQKFVARSDLQADETFAGLLEFQLATAADSARAESLYQAGITESLRRVATDSLTSISNRGLGFALGVSLPVSPRMSFRVGLSRFGYLREVSGGVTYYTKAVDPEGLGANPDGAIRSLIVALDGTYHTRAKQTFVALGMKYPLSRAYTFTAGLVTNLGGVNRIGISLKGYLTAF